MKAYEVFDGQARSYDGPRRRLIPCYDDFYGTAVDILPFGARDSFRVLDLGAGTGLLSSRIKEVFPDCRLTVQDASERMLEIARERFAGRDHVRFLKSDYTSDPLPGGFHVVVSALSIHHLTGPEKKELFARVFHALEPGGLFINADQRMGSSPRLEKIYQEHWLNNVRRSASPEEVEASLERKKADRMSTLEEQLLWLREAGFGDVDCRYANYSFIVYAGFRVNGLT